MKMTERIYSPVFIFNAIKEVEESYAVDDIKLQDGTRIWNLIRIILYFYFQKKRKERKIKNPFPFLNESIKPIKIPDGVKVCGFSGTESRKYKNGKFYDIYMDPLYDILGDKFCVFEWPTPQGLRREYKNRIYSKKYVAMHIPLLSKTFVNIAFQKITKKRCIKSKEIDSIVAFFSKKMMTSDKKLLQVINEAVSTFFHLKNFFVKILEKLNPEAILIRCGYGRFHMALSQACKELDISSIELQHGIITKYHAGYVRDSKSDNKDCVPEYLLTYGDAFSNIVKKSCLFDAKKVASIGFPYMEEVKSSPLSIDNKMKRFLRRFSATCLASSQWIIAEEMKNFFIDVSKQLSKMHKKIGIIFKPHPRDERNYDDMKKYENIFLVDKYEDFYEILKAVDIHSTFYSTTGIEALAFGKPNIFIDFGKTSMKDMMNIVDNKSSFIVSSPAQFVEKIQYILSNYENISKNAMKKSEVFFKPNAKDNFRKFYFSLKNL